MEKQLERKTGKKIPRDQEEEAADETDTGKDGEKQGCG